MHGEGIKSRTKDHMEPSQGKQKGKAKEGPKDNQLARTKKRERASFSRGRKLSHPHPF
jgi:hypothetical protein